MSKREYESSGYNYGNYADRKPSKKYENDYYEEENEREEKYSYGMAPYREKPREYEEEHYHEKKYPVNNNYFYVVGDCDDWYLDKKCSKPKKHWCEDNWDHCENRKCCDDCRDECKCRKCCDDYWDDCKCKKNHDDDDDHKDDKHDDKKRKRKDEDEVRVNSNTGSAGPLGIITALTTPITVVSTTIDTTKMERPDVLLTFTSIINTPINSAVTLVFQIRRVSREGGSVILGSTFTFTKISAAASSESFSFQFFDRNLRPDLYTYSVELTAGTVTNVAGVSVTNATLTALADDDI